MVVILSAKYVLQLNGLFIVLKYRTQPAHTRVEVVAGSDEL